MNNILVRKANKEELDGIVRIFKNAIAVMDKNNIPQWDEIYPNREVLTDDIAKGHMFVCEKDDQMVAVFVLNQECDDEYKNGEWQYKEASFAVVHRLCVNPNFQNKGIGRQTMLIAEKLVKEKGIETIRLDAFSNNLFALALYERLGYKRVGEVIWRKGLFYLYEKKI
jgi:ribosomal protein S18 acetylase RimI-like enzyme